MLVTIRKFERSDIPLKVKWINNPVTNRFLHYELPLEIAKTEQWFDNCEKGNNRYDAVIEADGIPCGTIGLLSIDRRNCKAEYYVAMGEDTLKGKGIAYKATRLILEYAFEELKLNKVYLFTERENIAAQKLFEKVGFIKEGFLKEDIVSHGKYVDRFTYGICRNQYQKY